MPTLSDVARSLFGREPKAGPEVSALETGQVLANSGLSGALVRYGTAVTASEEDQDSGKQAFDAVMDGSAGYAEDGTMDYDAGAVVRLLCAAEVAKGQRVKVTEQGGSYVVDALDSFAEGIAGAKQAAEDAKKGAEDAKQGAEDAKVLAAGADSRSQANAQQIGAQGEDIRKLQAQMDTTTRQYFWHDDQGAHVTTSPGSVAGKNTLINSNGMQVRDGTSALATFGADQVTLNRSFYIKTDASTGLTTMEQSARVSGEENYADLVMRSDTLRVVGATSFPGVTFVRQGAYSWTGNTPANVGLSVIRSGYRGVNVYGSSGAAKIGLDRDADGKYWCYVNSKTPMGVARISAHAVFNADSAGQNVVLSLRERRVFGIGGNSHAGAVIAQSMQTAPSAGAFVDMTIPTVVRQIGAEQGMADSVAEWSLWVHTTAGKKVTCPADRAQNNIWLTIWF